MLEVVVAVWLSVPAAFQAPQDTLRDLERAARTAAYRYEYLQRRLAPERLGGGFGGECDEVIGRFCFRFSAPDRPEPPPHPEPPEVEEWRTVAVRAHRRWFSKAPAEPVAASRLVRYLVDAGRADEAVAAARTHVWAAKRSPESLLLLGFALHYTADFGAAEEAFDSARVGMSVEERRELDDVQMLLDPGERSWYRRLEPEAREGYEARLWALSDPSMLDRGNERRSAHYARHVWATILDETPRAQGMLSWGDDHTEITLRYGLPVSRERIRQPLNLLHATDVSLIESFDPHAVGFVPGALSTRGAPVAPPPGVRPEIERDTARSAYAPIRLHRVRGLTLQLSAFPTPTGAVLRVDARLPADTSEPRVPVRPRGLFVLLDTLGREVERVPATLSLTDDSAVILTAELHAPSGPHVYRAELADDSTGLAALAQYAVEIVPATGLALSDLLLAEPFGDRLPRSRDDEALRALRGAVVRGGAPFGVYAEVRGLARRGGAAAYEVEWWLESADAGSLLGRAARWVGRTLGVVEPERPLRLRWEDVAESDPAVVAFTIDPGDVDPGPYRLGLIVRDRVSGESRTMTRLILIEPRSAAAHARSPR